MPVDDGQTGLWSLVVPSGATDTNLVTNPSFETATTGWTATSSTITRTAGAGVFGGYGGRLLASAQNGNAAFTVAAVANGSSNAASAWVKATSVLVKLRCVIGATTVDQAHPGDGLWHRLSVSVTAPSATTPVVSVRDERASAWANVDVDGVQVETGVATATSYLDGDQDGCVWTGAPHGSTSTRDGRDGRGGAITSFDSLGLYVTEMQGMGTPPINVATQGYAYTDGSTYQRSLAKERVLTLIAEMLYPTGLIGALHTVRAAVISAFNLDKRTGRGPIVLRYGGASTSKRLAAYYEGGLEMEKLEPTTDVAAMRFICPDPFYAAEVETQAALTTPLTVSSVVQVALRDAAGAWSNMGGGGSGVVSSVVSAATQLLDGRIAVGGTIVDFGGVAANDNLAVWDGVSWATLGGNAPNAYVQGMCLGLDGKLYISGNFTTIGGVTVSRVAVWSPSTNTWAAMGGTTDAGPGYLAVDPATGYIWASGAFTSIGGVAAAGVAYWNGAAWVAAATGVSGGLSSGMVAGPNGRMYVLSSTGLYVWGGASWSLVVSIANAFTLLSANGLLYIAGAFSSIGGVTAAAIASYNGSGWSTLGSGISGGLVQTLATDAAGNLYASGGSWATIGGITPPDSIAVWNGSSWSPFSVNPPDTATHANDIYRVFHLASGAILLSWSASSGTFGSTLTTQAITTVTNGGSAIAYPVVTFDSSGQLFSLENLTTGQSLYFNNLGIASGEIATLDLRPGRKTFTAPLRDLRPYILPGSDLATFCLAPGANRIAAYALGGTTIMRFKARSWSPD